MVTKKIQKKLFYDIEKAFDYHDVEDWRKKAQRIVGYVNGQWGRSGEENRYIVNTIYNLTNLIVPSLFYQAPWIRVSPTKRFVVKKLEGGEYQFIEASRSATLFEHVINDLIKKLDLEDKWRKCLQDSLVYGFGVMKLGYDAGDTEVERDVNLDPKEEIFAERICPLDLGWDPMCTCIEDARFIIQRMVRPLTEVQEDENYTGAEDLKGMDISEETPKNKKKTDSKDGGEWVELYEYHDQVVNKIYTIVKQAPANSRVERQKTTTSEKSSYKVLWERKNPHKFKAHFTLLKFTGDNDKFVSPSMLGMVEDEALATNEITTLMVNHARMFPGQILAEQGALDEDEVDAIENGKQGSIITTQNGAMREGRVQRTPPSPMGNDYFNCLNALGGLVDKVLGVNDFQRPDSTKRKTATEVSYEGQDSAIRKSYFLHFVKRFIIQTTKKVAKLVQQYYDEEREIKITGEFDEFWKWSKEDLDGDFDFDFDVESIKTYSASRAQGLINMLNVLSQYQPLQPILAQLDPEALAEELAKNLDINFEALKKQRSISHLEYDPWQENELVKQGNRLHDPHPGEEHQQHLAIHMALAQELSVNPQDLRYAEIFRHIQMTEFIMEAKQAMPGQQMMQAAPQGLMQGMAQGSPGAMGGPAPAQGATMAGAEQVDQAIMGQNIK